LIPSQRVGARAESRVAMEVDEEILWTGTLFISLNGEDSVAIRAQFVEEVGYEPPQGIVRVDECPQLVEGGRSRWILSEDPDDRKDGLWVWGLFKEPLYPFILFELELDVPCTLPDGTNLEAGVYYFQGDHSADEESGSTLTSGKVSRKVAVSVPLPGAEDFAYQDAQPVGSYVARSG